MNKRMIGLSGCVGLLILMSLVGPSVTVADDDKTKAQPAAEKDRDFSGKYLAAGESIGDKPYKAMVEIKRDGEVYDVMWVLGPQEAYRGVGLVERGSLCVGWATGQSPGLIIFTPEKDLLVGRWVAPGARGKVFKETLTPLK